MCKGRAFIVTGRTGLLSVVILIAGLLSGGIGPLAEAAEPVRPLPELAERTVSIAELARESNVRIYRITLDGAVVQSRGTTGNPRPLTLVLTRRGEAWVPMVAAQASSFNQGIHHGKVRDTNAGTDSLTVEMNIGSDRWVPGDPEAHYTLTLQTADDGKITGSFTGSFQKAEVKGDISGHLESPGWYGVEANADGSLDFKFDMGTTRKNWNHARWAGFNFFRPTNITAYDGILVTVKTDNPRQDAWLDLGLHEMDGSAYLVRDAVPLTQTEQTVFVRFDDLRHAEFLFDGAGRGPGVEGNFDEDFHFDRNTLYRLTLGVNNPHGVGEVAFTLTDLRFATLNNRPDLNASVQIDVTGKLLTVNEQQTIPGGMFGFHDAGGDWSKIASLRTGSIRPLRAMGAGGAFVAEPKPEYGIDLVVSTNYDRKQQLPQIAGEKWIDQMKSTGRKIGEQAKGKPGIAIEFWNEPYLDLGRMLENELAKRVKPDENTKPGDPVILHGQPMSSMVWTQDGDKLVPRDPTRFTYWSGKQIGDWYADAFIVVAKEVKAIAPEVEMIGGFGFRWSEDDWAAWDLLYKDMIDRSIEYLDGVCEHHYQGYTDGMAASFEVLTAYGVAEHGKWLKSWNTETNDLWDAPARGNAYAINQFGGQYRSKRRLVYNLRDILYTIMQTPDKAEVRAIHALWSGKKDHRVRINETYSLERDIDLKVTNVEFSDRFTYTHVDDGQRTLDAPAGKTYLIVTTEVNNKSNCKDKGYWPSNTQILIETKAQIAGTPSDVAAFDSNHKTKDKYPYLNAPPKGSVTGRAAYLIDRSEREAIITLQPGEKTSHRVHLGGPFEPMIAAPWELAGIDKGEYLALDFMKNLRGRMVQTISADHDLWAVSSVDEQTKTMSVIIYNDHYLPRTTEVKIKAPGKSRFASMQVTRIELGDAGEVALAEAPLLPLNRTDATTTQQMIAPASATLLTFQLTDLPTADAPSVSRQQVFARTPAGADSPILHRLSGGASITLPFPLNAEQVSKATAASVRVIVERVGEGEAWLTIDGRRYDLPRAHTPANAPAIREVPISLEDLAKAKTITFHAGGNGYLLCAASLVLTQHHD